MGIFSMGPSNDGSIFRTQANTQFNSFNNPMPTLNMSGPGWGVDQSYLTPSYASLYRPGSQEEPITSARPGFFHSVNKELNPFASAAYGKWGDPFLGQQQYRESIVPKAGDAAMWTAQNIGVGTASFWLSGKVVGGMARMGGHAGAGAMGAAWGESLFSSVARGAMGKMAGSNIGGAMGISGAAGVAGRGVGALFGSIALPLMFAQGAVEATDAALFNPYANQRNTGRSLRENFSGMTFGGGDPNTFTGRGMSFQKSNSIAGQITGAGFSNWSMTGKEISSISDLASRSGILDNVDPKNFAKQISSITKQVAIIAAVANDPDFRNSIEIMAKLKSAGLDVNQSSSFMSKLGSQASVAGVSTKRMMELSTQGQFIFGANNLTPYLGTAAYGQSMSSFAAAQRSGLISPALMARMGGVEGATQASLTGMVNAAQTPYNKILMANQYMFGTGPGSNNIAGNLSRFGQGFAGDPLGAAGAMSLYGGAMASDQMRKRGPLAAQDQLIHIASQMGMLNRDGTLDDTKAHLLATNYMGLGNSESEALVTQLKAGRNPEANRNMRAGTNSAYAKDVATMMRSHGIDGMLPIAMLKSGMRDIGSRAMTEFKEVFTDPFTSSTSKAADWLGITVDELSYGKIAKGDRSDVISAEDALGGKIQTTTKLKVKGEGFHSRRDARKLEGALAGIMESNNVYSRKFVNATNESEARKALTEWAENDAGFYAAVGGQSGIEKIVKQVHGVGSIVERETVRTVSQDLVGKYVEDAKRNGFELTDLFSSFSDKEGIREGYSKMWNSSQMADRGRDALDPAMKKLQEDLLGMGLSTKSAQDAWIESQGGSVAVAKNYAGKYGGNLSEVKLKGNPNVRQRTSSAEVLSSFGARNEAHAEEMGRLDMLQKEGKITTSVYAANISKIAGEKMESAAVKMLMAGDRMLAAAGLETDSKGDVIKQESTFGYAARKMREVTGQ